MKNSNQKSWDKHAKRFFKEISLPFDTVDYCGTNFPTENDLHLIGNVSGLKVLELGAGSCNCGIVLAKQGADVTCLDGSKEQLTLGRKNAKKYRANIKTIHADFHDLKSLKNNEYDIVLSVCAFQYAKNIKHIFHEVHRVLKDGGKFIFSLDHPIMKALEAKLLYPNEKSLHSAYCYTGPEKWKWEKDDDFWFTTYRRPVSDYLNALVNAELQIKRVIDLYQNKNLVDCSDAERKIKKEFPTILVVKSEK